MLERATFDTTTGTGPKPAKRPPPPRPPPRPPLVPGPPGDVAGRPARHTAYPVTPAIINRKITQINPRFFDLAGRGGVGPCLLGRSSVFTSVGFSFVVIIKTAYF